MIRRRLHDDVNVVALQDLAVVLVDVGLGSMLFAKDVGVGQIDVADCNDVAEFQCLEVHRRSPTADANTRNLRPFARRLCGARCRDVRTGQQRRGSGGCGFDELSAM